MTDMPILNPARHSLSKLDRLIIAEYASAKTDGRAIAEVESLLADVIGDHVHQSVSGNVRHLVEDGLLIKTRKHRRISRRRHAIYVHRDFYSSDNHGIAAITLQKPRKAVIFNTQISLLRNRIYSAKPTTICGRVRDLLFVNPQGFICDEVERKLNAKHATVSARLSDMEKAGLVIRASEKRRPSAKRRPQSVYRWHEYQ